jgi:hypothetical protein
MDQSFFLVLSLENVTVNHSRYGIELKKWNCKIVSVTLDLKKWNGYIVLVARSF